MDNHAVLLLSISFAHILVITLSGGIYLIYKHSDTHWEWLLISHILTASVICIIYSTVGRPDSIYWPLSPLMYGFIRQQIDVNHLTPLEHLTPYTIQHFYVHKINIAPIAMSLAWAGLYVHQLYTLEHPPVFGAHWPYSRRDLVKNNGGQDCRMQVEWEFWIDKHTWALQHVKCTHPQHFICCNTLVSMS